VLANQHYSSMKKFCAPFGVKVDLLTGGTPASTRGEIERSLSTDPRSLLVGTHAILEDWVPMDSLGFLVIDEQHRFGVAQREKLLEGIQPRPHALVMSATPIPRTLAMTFYGDLDLSVLDMMPPGRGSTETRIVAQSDKAKVFRFMLERLEHGERVFMVYPLKEASEKSDLKDAATAFEIVASGPMAAYGAGLLHGSMPPAEKVGVTEKFSRGDIGVLVSTTVIEVGIDVPEATVMVIVNAERFGLSQLHQLRGRVGRGGRNAWCFLVPGENASSESLERLEVLVSTSDGFVVAEKDLQTRGPGQVLGTAQHGIPQFRVADLSMDGHLVGKVNALEPLPLEDVHRMIGQQMWRYGDMELPGV
jgi:ATP-dependent DNA helicase RecG